METKKVMELENHFIMHTYDRSEVLFESGKGCYLYDDKGKEYLDFVGGIATASLGHGNNVISSTLYEQSKKLISSSNLFYMREQAVLAEKLAKISGLSACFFSNSGAESVETAIKLAKKYTGKQELISTEGAFHGRTLGALSLTWKEKFRMPYVPLIPGIKFIPYNNTSALADSITDNTSAFIVEPVQGEAGIYVPQRGYLKEARKICKERDCLLIVDEIQTNMRTGKFFAYQHEDILPDIVTVAKGIAGGVPIGITIANKDIASAFQPGDHGCTFGGNSLSCASANAVIDFVLKNNLIEKAGVIGEYFMKRLAKLQKKYNSIKEVRGKGLMVGIELDIHAKPIVDKCLAKGLLVNKCNEHVLRFLPPLIVTKEQIDLSVGILDEVFSELL